MRLLHTSDWHLGASLCGRSRADEHARFLQWLVTTAQERNVDVLVVAGDVFDTTNPSNRAQNLYFDFLHALRETACRTVVVVGGNHDSPSHLNAPANYLARDGVRVVGCAPADAPDGEILTVRNGEGTVELVVCAVPFLRDRDVRADALGGDPALRGEEIRRGVVDHYRRVAERAHALVEGLDHPVPVVATGHLYARGSTMTDGEDNLTVGTLDAVDSAPFANLFAYTALGHIHTAQRVGSSDRVRYSGSPLAMSFGERAAKTVLLVDFGGAPEEAGGEAGPAASDRPIGSERSNSPESRAGEDSPVSQDGQAGADSPAAPQTSDEGEDVLVALERGRAAALQRAWPVRVEAVEVPVFRTMVEVRGKTVAELEEKVRAVATVSPDAWIAADYVGDTAPEGPLVERLTAALKEVEGSGADLLRVRDLSSRGNFLVDGGAAEPPALEQCEPGEIFELLLQSGNVAEERRPMLRALFAEVLAGLDANPEDAENGTGGDQGVGDDGQARRAGRAGVPDPA